MIPSKVLAGRQPLAPRLVQVGGRALAMTSGQSRISPLPGTHHRAFDGRVRMSGKVVRGLSAIVFLAALYAPRRTGDLQWRMAGRKPSLKTQSGGVSELNPRSVKVDTSARATVVLSAVPHAAPRRGSCLRRRGSPLVVPSGPRNTRRLSSRPATYPRCGASARPWAILRVWPLQRVAPAGNQSRHPGLSLQRCTGHRPSGRLARLLSRPSNAGQSRSQRQR